MKIENWIFYKPIISRLKNTYKYVDLAIFMNGGKLKIPEIVIMSKLFLNEMGNH